MRTFLLLIIASFFSLLSLGQLAKLKGNWINSNQEYIIINDTTNNSNGLCNQQLSEKQFDLCLYTDTLSFQSRYTTSTDNYSKQHIDRYDFKIIKLSDSILTLQVVSSFSKNFFKNGDTLKFIRQQYFYDSSLRFEKLIFHTTECFGNCPILHIQVDSNRQLLYSVRSVRSSGLHADVDNALSGNFKGLLNKQDYDKLIFLLKTCSLRTVRFKEQYCCDAPVITIITYFNGERKYIKSMFLPAITRDLISFLYGLNKKVILHRISDKIQLEE